MNISFAAIRAKRHVSGPLGDLEEMYLARTKRFVGISTDVFRGETEFFDKLGAAKGRMQPIVFLADSRGKSLTSEQFAENIRTIQERGAQQLYWAVGPADGWSEAAIVRADLVVSFGRITLPHELAAVVAAEQLYRAFTILAGHPYHKGH